MTWRDVAAALCFAAIGIAGLSLVSYATGLDALKHWGGHPMAINTALALIFLGAAVLVRDRDGK